MYKALFALLPLFLSTEKQSSTEPVNAKSRKARLCGVSFSTVKRLVAAWSNASRQENLNSEYLKEVVYKISGTGSVTPPEMGVTNNSETFVSI